MKHKKTDAATDNAATPADPANGNGSTTRRSPEKIRSGPADFGGPPAREDQAERQGFDRQRLEPQDQPPADVLDRGNLAGEKDFELGPGGKG